MSDFTLEPAAGFAPRVGQFVTMLEDTRRRLLRDLEDLDEMNLDRRLGWAPNSIGTLLYHIAAIELDWAFADLGETTEFPEGTEEWFPVDVRDQDGRLSPVVEPFRRHLNRLAWVRSHLLEVLGGLADEDIDREFVNADDGSRNGGAWILHHLMQHEAEHRGQIGELRAALRHR